MKLEKDPRSLLFPCPVVLVTCIDSNGQTNIITLAWAGIASSDPPTLGLAIRPYRYSFKLIEAAGELVVNIPTTELLQAV
ncbi:flavin reductase family protein, partial [[Eubacterium] cellulosolvens]